MKLLDGIDSPAGLKNLTQEQLNHLAEEIREELIATVTGTGGHLASNLGVVELTLALHRVFRSPQDKIVWDVGHQCYVHKMLTGRRRQLATLRQYGGLSGYTCRDESEHDPFGAGHASTSVSAALGMAIARDLAGKHNHVVAVIGDGAITGGMALEALNHAGHLGSRLIVVLNHNGMSISPTVGALARILNKVRLDHRYHQAKEGSKQLIKSLPMGGNLWEMGQHLEKALKGLVMPTVIWEELGFTYVGPVDGHNIAEVEEALSQARDYPHGPTLVHVITTKGKGYSPAENDAVHFHGLSAKTINVKDAPTYSDIFARTVLKLSREDPRIVSITPAMPEGSSLTIVKDEFPDRVFDVGICEQHAVTFAAGLATQGYRPIVAIYSTFLQRAFDQVIHDVCLQDLPVVFAIDRAGIVGDDGKTHQGAFDVSYLSMIPNLIISAPMDENELQHLLYTAIKAEHPMAIRYPRCQVGGVEMDAALHEIPVGKGEILMEGKDIGIIAIGSTVIPALEAANELASAGVDATMVNARFVKPLDTELILRVANSAKQLITIEENSIIGGLGSMVTALLQKAGISNVPVKCLGITDEFVEHGSQAIIRAKYNLNAKGIAREILNIQEQPSG